MNTEPIRNGNRFVTRDHIFVRGDGCYFHSKESAREGISSNAIGVYFSELEFEGKTYFQALAANYFE